MKRVLSLILTAVILLSSFGALTVFGESTIATVLSEDFETGTFTVETNTDNNIKQLKKDGNLVMTFAKKSGTTFSGFPDETPIIVDATTNAPLNNTKVFETTSSCELDNTKAYINFGQKYTKGKITIDLRMRRMTNSTTNRLYITSDPITGYDYNGDYINNFEYNVNSSYRSRFRYYQSYTDESTSSSTAYKEVAEAKGWPYFRFVVDINNKTISTYYATSAGSYALLGTENANWYANGTAGSFYMADGVSGFFIDGDTWLALDDILVTHEISEVAPVASDVTVTGNPYPGSTLTGTYGTYTDSNGDEELGSVATWYAADDKDFTANVVTLKTEAITAGNTSTYTVTENEVGRYIRFGITPKNGAIDLPIGEDVFAVVDGVVRVPQTKPVVTLITPTNNSNAWQGATIFLSVDASCDNASITKVEYYANDELIATSTQAPFSAEWMSDELEDYAIYAIAYNNLGQSTQSETSYISIQYYDPTQEETEEGAKILFKDDFETGVYTVTQGTEASGNHYKEVYKDGKLQWTIAKSGTDAFSDTFPTDSFVADSIVTASENGSKYFTLGGRHTDGVKVWHNLDEEIASGIVNLDLRMNFSPPSSGDYPTSISFYDDMFIGYASSPKKVFEIRITKVSAGGRIRYSWPWKTDSSRGDATGNTSTTNPPTGHWMDFKISVNLDTQKVKFWMKPYGSEEFIPFNSNLAGYDLNFYANSTKADASTTGTFTRATKIAAIGFDGNSKGFMAPLSNATLEFDDIVISREESTISFLKEDDVSQFDNILAGNTKVSAKTIISGPKSVALLIGAYDENNKLLAINSSEAFTLADGETKEILTPLAITDELEKSAAYLKAFAWDIETLTPHIKAATSQLERDIIGDKELDIYLLMGQSNMSGRAPYTTAEAAQMDRTYLFNNSNRWDVASNPLNKYSTLGDSSSQIAMGPSYTFAKTLTQYLPDTQLGLVVNAKGGSAIAQWMKGTFYYENSVAKAKEAMKYGNLKGIIWHQGCSNASKWNEYMPQLQQMVADLRADLGDDTIPFIAGQLNPSTESKASFNTMIATISQHIPYSSYAKADDLSTIDGTHFDAPSQRILGQRYATEILRMNYGITGRVFEEGNVNLALDATPSASASYSTYTPSNGKDDSTSTYWQAYKTGDAITDMPYYILDLGRQANINYVSITDKQSDMTNETRQWFALQLSNDPNFNDYVTIGNNEDIVYYQKSSFICRNKYTDGYRYVRVIKTKPGNLALSEISVMGN
ncbi:MAG: sialate O-acetylesterase [Eubacteriales bacterium]|nr:sialate O-acetylesterase [Eubacteriales bacterium]